MNPAYIPAFSALAGALIGGLTSLSTSWFTQHTQFRNAIRHEEREKLETLYRDFIDETALQFADALVHQLDGDDVSKVVRLYALVGQMRVISARAVVDAAVRIESLIIDTYLEPNRTVIELRDYARNGAMKDLLTEFSEACRNDLAARIR